MKYIYESGLNFRLLEVRYQIPYKSIKELRV